MSAMLSAWRTPRSSEPRSTLTGWPMICLHVVLELVEPRLAAAQGDEHVDRTDDPVAVLRDRRRPTSRALARPRRTTSRCPRPRTGARKFEVDALGKRTERGTASRRLGRHVLRHHHRRADVDAVAVADVLVDDDLVGALRVREPALERMTLDIVRELVAWSGRAGPRRPSAAAKSRKNGTTNGYAALDLGERGHLRRASRRRTRDRWARSRHRDAGSAAIARGERRPRSGGLRPPRPPRGRT